MKPPKIAPLTSAIVSSVTLSAAKAIVLKTSLSLTVALGGLLLAAPHLSQLSAVGKSAPLPQLEETLTRNFAYVHEIDGFYIVASAQPPRETSPPKVPAKEIFIHSVALFSSLLDQDEDGTIDNPQLLRYLANGFIFAIAYRRQIDRFDRKLERFDRYLMGMHTDEWPYVRGYQGKFPAANSLTSSTWRPENFDATWEEAFHTITEAFALFNPSLSFEEGSPVSELMRKDIAAGSYDISEQNREEQGNYDWLTAVNEYLHQIWVFQFAGQAATLNSFQKQALTLMQSAGVPMRINKNYAAGQNGFLGRRLKE